ncbi:MAG: large conductance mechanosensitive channel protein MscL [Actinomycetota bacterium]
MVQEFKDFLMRGNLIALAVAFVMGVAFAAIVGSFVNDLVMPIIAIPFGQPNFSSLTWTINDSVIMWGSFVTAAVIFVLTALAVFFFIVRPYNAFEARQAEEEDEAPEGPSDIDLLTEIRDLLAR